MAKLSEIKGVEEADLAKLGEAGITSIEMLLELCGEKKGRKDAAEQSGISEKTILNWLNRADLSRIKGVSTQYADLLECAGVDTVPELAQRKPENLQEKMVEVNEDGKFVQKLPTVTQVQGWVAQAKALPRAINY